MMGLTFLAVPPPVTGGQTVTDDLPLADRAPAAAAAWRMCGTYVLQITVHSLAVQQHWKSLPQLQICYETLERRLVFDGAGGQCGQSNVGWDPPHEQVTGHNHVLPLGLHLGRFFLIVHHQPGLPVVAGEEDPMPAQVVDARLGVQGGRFGTVDGEAHLQPPIGHQELQEVTVAAVVHVQHQCLAHIGFQDKTQFACCLGVPLAIACPLTRNPLIFQSYSC